LWHAWHAAKALLSALPDSGINAVNFKSLQTGRESYRPRLFLSVAGPVFVVVVMLERKEKDSPRNSE